MQDGCLKLVHFSRKSGDLSSMGSKILTFGSHCSGNFQPILDCFIPKFKLEYYDLENTKTDCVNAVVFNLNQIKRLTLFRLGCFGTIQAGGDIVPPSVSPLFVVQLPPNLA